MIKYRIYSNKRRIWDKKVSKRHIPDALIRWYFRSRYHETLCFFSPGEFLL